MHSATRRERIEEMLRDDPRDVFLRYSLAMELRKEGDHPASLDILGKLIKNQPPYVPAFFMSAQQQVELRAVEEARATLRAGIEEARRQQNLHAAGEMSELLTSLGEQGE